MIEMKKENEEEETFYRKSDKRGRFLPTQGLVRFRLWFTLMGKWENTLRGGGRGKRGALIVAYPVLGVILCHQHSNTVMSIWDSREKDLALHLKEGWFAFVSMDTDFSGFYGVVAMKCSRPRQYLPGRIRSAMRAHYMMKWTMSGFCPLFYLFLFLQPIKHPGSWNIYV